MDWKKARKEYIAGGISMQEIADKYGTSLRTVQRKAKAEEWTVKRHDADVKSAEKVADSIANERARADTLVFNTAVKLLEAINGSINVGDAMFPKAANDYAAAVRAIQQTLDAKPTELDVEEQKARIEKLRRDYLEKENQNAGVEVVLGEGLDQYGV